MKFLRFLNDNKEEVYGLYKNNEVHELEGDIFGEYSLKNKIYNLDNIKILPPTKPSKIIAVGLNYKAHAEEMKRDLPENPMLFMKPSTAVIAHMENIEYPSHMSKRVDYEGELAVVIGKKTRMASEENSLDNVLGYTCINDVTARDLQAKDIQFTRGKGFDTFAPIGPFIETELDPFDVKIKSYLNGELRQNSSSSDLIFNIPKLVSFISQVMTLLPGDIIATGTPSGVGPVKPGDKVEIELEGIGKLVNQVV